MVPPSGLLNQAGLGLTPVDTEVFLSDEALSTAEDDPADVPPVVESDGRRIAVTDHRVAEGGPGPDDPTGMVALRQRLLAEAAVRSLAGDNDDLVVDLPFDFDPGTDSGVFFDGLEQPFLEIVPAAVDHSGTVPTVDRVTYPTRQVVRELNEGNFVSSQRFLEAGDRLDGILVRNDQIGDDVLREALCTVSYMFRDDPVSAQASADAGTAWLVERLRKVRIEAPSFVLLSSDEGPFAVTVTNDLDQPVRIRILAQTRDDLVIRAPEEIDLEAGTRQTVQLTAEAGSIGVHPVRLVATDVDGQPTGSFDEIDIRSNTVGKIIWVIMGVGRRHPGDLDPGPLGAQAPPRRRSRSMSTPKDTPKTEGADSSLLSNSAVMAAGTIVSRMSGYVRSILLAAALGNLLHADIFTIANTIPNMLYILLAGGIFNAVLVPQLMRAMRNDEDRGEAYTNRVVTLAGLFLGVVTVLLIVAAPYVMSIFLSAQWDDPGAGRGAGLAGRLRPAVPAAGLLLRDVRARRADPQLPRPVRPDDVGTDRQQRGQHGRPGDLHRCLRHPLHRRVLHRRGAAARPRLDGRHRAAVPDPDPLRPVRRLPLPRPLRLPRHRARAHPQAGHLDGAVRGGQPDRLHRRGAAGLERHRRRE